jgi:nucleoside-diphosphate-sugar epimerase
MLVLVTGGTGFIGNYVVEALLKEGHEIIVTGTNREKAEKIVWFNKVTFIELDIENKDHQDFFFQRIPVVQKLIHLAWQGLPNYKELYHFEKNLLQQYLFLKKVIESGVKDITITGTCFEYGMQNGCLRPDMPSEPENSYALAKDTLRKFLEQLKKSEEFNLKWLRLFYMYGKGQSEKSILSQLDRALEKGDVVFKMSGGEQLRDYLPVEEVAHIIVSYSLYSEESFIKNVCSGFAISIKDLVENHLKIRNKNIELDLGYYPYSDFEPFAFWGSR